MTKIISIGKWSFKMIYIILLAICQIMSSCGVMLFSNNGFKFPIFQMLVMFFAESLIFFVYLFQRYLVKDKKSTEYEILPGNQKIKTIFIIVCLSICDASTSIINEILYTSEIDSYQIIFKALFFVFTIYLCIYMLKFQFYRHHYLGIVIYFIGLICYTLVDYLYKDEEKKENDDETKTKSSTQVWVIIIIMVVTQFLGSLLNCTEKYLIDKKYINPFVIISFEGISGCIIMSILIPVLSLIPSNNGFFDYVDNANASFQTIFGGISSTIAWIIIYTIIVLFFLNIFRLLVNQHFLPLHQSICNSFSIFINYLFKAFAFNMVKNVKAGKVVLLISADLLMIFGVLLFLEIITLNFCGLSDNTKEQIDLRNSVDYNEIREIMDERLSLFPLVQKST